MRLHILVLDGVFDLGLAALTDTLSTANQLAGSLAQAPAPVEVTLVGMRRHVRTAQGLTVPVASVHRVPKPDVVLVPALGAKMPDHTGGASCSCRRGRRGSRVAAMVALRCGRRRRMYRHLLAGRKRATGRSARNDVLVAGADVSAALSGVALDESRMLVNSARVITAGAALAHLDLALSVVRSRSPALAALAARYLLIEARGSQAEFVITNHLSHADPVVERFEGWARQQLAHGFSLAAAATQWASASVRWRGACIACWVRRRCRTFRIYVSSAQCNFCARAARASTKSPNRSGTPMA
jgi:hypothetical protein